MDSLNFSLKPGQPRFRVHLLLLVVFVHAFCDLFRAFFSKLGKFSDKMNLKTGGKEPEKLSYKDMGDFSKVLTKENMRPFRLLKGLTVVLGFLAEFLLPYYLFNKTTRVLRTNFERQVNSYSPFTLVTCKFPNDPRDFLKSKKELEKLMEEELKAEQRMSFDVLEFFNSLGDLEDDSKEEIQKRLDKQVEKDTKKYYDDLESNKSVVFNLSSFNRFVVFVLSKAALHGLYVTFHALFSPHNHNAFVNSFRKKK